MKRYDIAIIGGGIGGLCAALSLQQKGHRVNLFEAAKELKPVGAGIGVGSNSLQALVKLGVGEKVMRQGNVLSKMIIQSHSGKSLNEVDFASLSKEFGMENITIHRADLQSVLLNGLQEGTVHLNKRYVDFSQDSHDVTVFFEDGDSIRADLVIAADGVHSLFRKTLIEDSSERYAGYTCWRSVVSVKEDVLQSDISTETWGRHGRFGIVPLARNQVYWFACINASRDDTDKANYKTQDLLSIFKDYPHPIPEMIQSSNDNQLLHDDILDIKPISQFAFGNIVLIGDAAHATTPNMGQGAGQAMEDVLFLTACLEQHYDLLEALQGYQDKRVLRSKKVIKMSRQIGEVAQWEQPWLTTLRDTLFKLIPSSIITKRLKFLYDID